MSPTRISRRMALLGACASVPGCSTLAALERSAQPRDTYDLLPVSGATGGPRSRKTLLILVPDAPATLETDRIMIRPTSQAIAYLVDARWSDDLPLLLQSLIIRSVASTQRIGFVGAGDAGPVPDVVLLTRIDAFEVQVDASATGQRTFTAQIALSVTLLRDRDQRIIGSRRFERRAAATSDRPMVIVSAFQRMCGSILPQVADWAVATASR